MPCQCCSHRFAVAARRGDSLRLSSQRATHHARLHAFGRCFKITVEVDGKAKEEFVDSRGQTWIAVEPGSAFQVKAKAEADRRVKGPNYHRLQLSLDGQGVYSYYFNKKAWAFTYVRVRHAELGDGSEILAFKFGEPGEEASGNRADALEITVTAERVID